jgi:hypothetical protein
VLHTNVFATDFTETCTANWDGIDVDQILKYEQLLKNYINCILEKGRCTPGGSELKSKKCLYSNEENKLTIR